MTHREQVLERALDNLVARIERGQELSNALDAVTSLYGVSAAEMDDAYAKFTGEPEETQNEH